MEIALLNILITVQKHTVVVDAIGNHTNAWEDYYTCHATASGENGSVKGSEDETAGTTVDHGHVDFTVRYCRKLEPLTTDEYRVLFNGQVFDIIGLDHMNFKRKCLKLRCKKVRR